MDPRVALKFDGTASASVDAYLEYRRIVGNDDNGKLFTPEEYEKYKKEVLPARTANRLYVSWTNSYGMDCKLIGPETKCFCQHRYKQHKTDFEKVPQARPIQLPCQVQHCPCSSYYYIPMNGTQSIRCHCKHYASDHTYNNKRQCTKSGCKCSSFKTSFNCACGEIVPFHETLVETRQERLDRGHPVAKNEPSYAAMGGITGFSSLMDGYMRLDDSGMGSLSLEELSAPTTSNSHPFERAFCPQGERKISHQKKRALGMSSNQKS